MELQLTKEQEAAKKWYEGNGFTDLLKFADLIEEQEKNIGSEIDELFTFHSDKKPREMNDEDKSQWHTNALRDMVRINQAMYGVIQLIKEMRGEDEK